MYNCDSRGAATESSNTERPMLLKLIYIANVVVAGTVGFLCLATPARASVLVFSGTASDRAALTVVGAFWLAIALLSVRGYFSPQAFQPVLLIQLVYKGLWLIVFAAPAYLSGRAHSVPGGIAAFFLVWVIVLPFAIDWSALIGNAASSHDESRL